MLKQTERGPSRATRRTGYVFAVVFNAVALYAIQVWPGWQEVPFLTSETEQVLGWVSATLIAGLAVNVVYLLTDPRWLKSLGDLTVTGIGLVAIIRVWQVFPFDFGDPWVPITRILLAIGFFGSIAAMIVQLVVLVADGSRARRR